MPGIVTARNPAATSRRVTGRLQGPSACATLQFGFTTVGPDQTDIQNQKDISFKEDTVKTYFPKDEQLQHCWLLIDAEGQTVGRLASRIAQLLRGKHKVNFTPNQAGGDFVVVVNADKVKFTGRKLEQKAYTRYSGYQGGLKSVSAGRMLNTHPERILEHAVRGMLPKNTLGRKVMSRLKVYAGSAHPHAAQQPEEVELD